MRGPSFPSPGVRLLVVSLLLAVPMLAGCLQDPDQERTPATELDPGIVDLYGAVAGDPELRFETDHGTIRIVLYEGLLPTTAGHIADLAEEGFYDDTIVHRVVDDFVIQGGDPSDTGQLGSGRTVPLETHPLLRFADGAVGLARDVDPDSGDSQWFITEKPAPHLHDPRGATGEVFGAYSMFGQVFEGMDVVRAIAAEPVVPGADRPVEDVVVSKAAVLPPPEGLDLLDLVRTLDEDGQGMAEVSRPLYLFANHTFQVRVFQPDDSTPWDGANIRYASGDRELANVQLVPLDDDPLVWTGEVTLSGLAPMLEGTVEVGRRVTQVVEADGSNVSRLDSVPLYPWYDVLAPYAGGVPGQA